MKLYIDAQPNESGAYPNPKAQPFPGCIELDEEQSALFLEYNGFVTISELVDGPVIVQPNLEAWEAWKAEEAAKPPVEPVPTPEEKLAALEQENKLLTAQMDAQSEQLDFYEDCIAEMAAVVYA